MNRTLNFVFKFLGGMIKTMHSLYVHTVIKDCISTFASFGKGSSLGYPFSVSGVNRYEVFDNPNDAKNIHIGKGVKLGSYITMYATRAKIVIGDRTFTGPNVTIMTGDHPFDIKGRYMADNKKYEIKAKGLDISKYDKDVIIDEDVWIGCNVTILKGVHIGRGAIVAAGSVVTKSIPAYCIGAGNPARVLKARWSVDDIIEHEKLLYGANERLSRDFIAECLRGIN